jgi:alkaline phosphatase D
MNIFNTKNSIVTLLLLLNYSVIQAQKLVSKPFVGHTDSTEINIWCMFKNADAVFIKNSDGQQKVFTWEKDKCFRNYLPVNVRFEHLTAGQQYSLSYSFNNQDFYPLITATTDNDSLYDLSFVTGSCAFISTGFNGIIKPFNSLKIFKHLQEENSSMMIWLGDNLYYILQSFRYKPQLKRNIKTRLNKKLNAFLHSKQNYAIWDDHDYGTNNSDASFKKKDISLNVFQQFWPNPIPDTLNYYSFKKSDAQFFMLDDRYNNEQEKEILGKQQLDWLKKSLAASNATFKFICIGMQALNPISTKECFYKTETEYKELVEFIIQHQINGVLFISGDRHHAELMKVQENGLYPLYDFTTSPLTMYPVKIGKKSKEYKNPYKIEGTYFPSYNYGKIALSGERKDRKCIIELKDKHGNTVWNYEIKAKNLEF